MTAADPTSPHDAAPDRRPATARPIAVIDVDGVVADVRHRLTHLQAPAKDWGAFFAAAADDPPIVAGVQRVQELARDHDIVWLTGRPESLRQVTLAWFAANGLPATRLVMRRANDRRPARVVKRAELRRLAARRTVAIVIDDDPAVTQALQADGCRSSRPHGSRTPPRWAPRRRRAGGREKTPKAGYECDHIVMSAGEQITRATC